ncbi:MAG: anthranilate synthase component I [candidate division NC10 bacterium]|nr:anthranilate synthase component I [candidate division NC10 bacterium]
MVYPSLEGFCQKAREGNLIPVYKEILADMETPVSAFRKIDSGNYAFLLESVEGGEKWGRYSFLGSNPSLVFKSKGRSAEVISPQGPEKHFVERDPLDLLKGLLSRYRPVRVEGLPRFFGGMVGYLAYDMVRFFEELPDRTHDDMGLPDALFLLTDTLLIFDNVAHKIKVVSNAHLPEGSSTRSLEEAYGEAKRKIDAIISSLRRPLGAPLTALKSPVPLGVRSNLTSDEFQKAVEAAKEYIKGGDAIQVVLSHRLQARTSADPFDIYRALLIVNPSPYMYYLRLGDLKIVGTSPEVLVRLEDGNIDLRPIAGTRPRGTDELQDQALAQELLADPKERAEHIMLVDLGRNDIGRVARIGSVRVSELMVIERYSHVMHIVSNVTGELQEGRDAFDLLRACFPAGTVTGAPKIRAMEIIEELEPTKRGPYAGAVGYFSFSGNMDTCITIRTILLKDGHAMVQAGAGIVADSQPEREYHETMSKAQAMLKAIEMAEAGLE